ncbi:carboxy-S-adenosyl-L-methionine synthase CmoA [Cocleimonas flava]|uniref:Carboxy-S-adenosyl-L-methionine synthase n=1 Tax=Cocleimonas flava TaxID=634765 RepID=A0A4R1F4C2_9GAMM|nr:MULTISPECIES: carboxy-S-adenosyl-L-methionine synthase CmoA [Cocleimonas]MEB8433634.1 carboxy-S-adenosyl-L-methionine synthase CmoA [Cocleimonas sp. KMM 6892]MEC4716445.1 carboxy-S-adenosyl-L-methionine synthase CmoA [Cocleimonas sp. KMM 6895]MEC4745662.1 carboxy-S-adenosyl-L-methionine synthase CmoA [Cocleimonas sp. KMM 6896]TCJ85281.1 tRNA (cmo5U34)-methyltransferase [Cocleimonas flava]
MKQDNIFANNQKVVDFAFDDSVADVFPDMIRRSVPGYETVISLLGVYAGQYAKDNSNVYDLGCSLGAATLAMHRQTSSRKLKHICIDNSEAMVKRCQSRLARHMPESDLDVLCEDIEKSEISNASLVVINFTLQFLSPESRLSLLKKVYEGMLPGGALILSEKIIFDNEEENQQQIEWYHNMKRSNGYSDLEISQKRAALENVMIPDTLEQHQTRLQEAGFSQSYQWFQSFNFISLVALKS